jgi:dynactin complex subunit
MNQRLKEVMKARYNAVIEDCKYKIKCYSDQEIIIPEHPDITLEIDKLLETMANAEEKLATIELHYGENKTKQVL